MVRLVKVEKENISDGDGGILSLANNIRNRVTNAIANKMPQDDLESTVDVPSEIGKDKTAVTLDDDYTQPTFEDFEKEADAKLQQHIEAQQKILKNQNLLKSTVDVPSEVVTKGGKDKTAVTLEDYRQPTFEEFEKETEANIKQFLFELEQQKKKKALNVISGVQTADADIHNILRKLQRSVNRIEHRQKTLQDDLKALQVQVQARQSQIRHSPAPADIDALAEAVVAKLQTNG